VIYTHCVTWHIINYELTLAAGCPSQSQ